MISIDPGIRGCGVAWWHGEQLTGAEYIPNPVKTGAGIHAVLSMARGVYPGESWPHDVVFEWPRIYTVSKSKGDPNDLLPLVAIGAICSAKGIGAAFSYFPHEWKGQVPKAIMEKRIKARLSPEELSRVHLAGAKSHNIWDAIGIGLHHLGRLR